MDNARRKLRVCLICVVMAAVVIGLIYYFNDMRSHGKMNEGTLVEEPAKKEFACRSGRISGVGNQGEETWFDVVGVQESRA